MSISITSIPGLINQLKTLFKDISTVETAVSELYAVTNETKETYIDFFTSANKSAQELGRSLSDLIQLTTEWAKLGYSIDDSGILAKTSAVYSAVSGVNDKTALSDIYTAMKAFHIEAKDSISIVDKLNAVGQQYNVTVADLGAELNKTASVFSLAGNSIDETIALLTVMTKVTQDSEKASNALHNLSMSLLGYEETAGSYTKDLENLDNTIINITKNTNNPSGISIFTDHTKNTCKSTYQFMKDISQIWNELSSQKQKVLLEVLTDNSNDGNLSALFQNMPMVDNILKTSFSSNGSAIQEQERQMDSFSVKTQQFNAAFQSLSQTVMDSTLTKTLLDLGASGLNTADNLTKIITPLGTIAGIVSGLKNTGKSIQAYGVSYSYCFEYALFT